MKAKSPQAIADRIRRNLEDPAWLESVDVAPDRSATLVIRSDGLEGEAMETRRMEAESAARSVAGVKEVTAVLAEPSAPPARSQASDVARKVSLIGGPRQASTGDTTTRRVKKGARLSDEAMAQSTPGRGEVERIPGIQRILVVASAKGGVGKSTVAVNLAAALVRTGMKVGLMDADIYGPSVPTMLGTAAAEPETSAAGKLVPVAAHGLKTLSIGYLSDPDAPMIWRGPIVMSAITQMLQDAEWGTPEDPLDLLIIDTPPGTGDAQLAIAQRVPVTAALLVTTPQEVALSDVRRGAAMFAKTAVPVLGIVETMSWFDDPAGNRHALLGEGGGARMAATLGLPLLAQVPLLQEIREGGDHGRPAAVDDGTGASLFHDLARRVAIGIDTLETKPAPEIVFEA